MKKPLKIFLIILLVILLILAALGVGAYIVYLNLTDTSNADKLNTKESKTIYEPLVKSVILGEKQTVTDDDINGILAVVINTYVDSLGEEDFKNQFTVKGVATYMKDNNSADIYADIYYNNDVRFIFYADTDISLDKSDKNILLELKSAKIGNMKIPVNMVTDNLKSALSDISSDITTDDKTIYIPSEYTFEFSGKEVNVYIEELEVSEAKAQVKTNSAMNLINQFIDGFIKDIFGKSA